MTCAQIHVSGPSYCASWCYKYPSCMVRGMCGVTVRNGMEENGTSFEASSQDYIYLYLLENAKEARRMSFCDGTEPSGQRACQIWCAVLRAHLSACSNLPKGINCWRLKNQPPFPASFGPCPKSTSLYIQLQSLSLICRLSSSVSLGTHQLEQLPLVFRDTYSPVQGFEVIS